MMKGKNRNEIKARHKIMVLKSFLAKQLPAFRLHSASCGFPSNLGDEIVKALNRKFDHNGNRRSEPAGQVECNHTWLEDQRGMKICMNCGCKVEFQWAAKNE